jgi:hypothetical protein
MIALILTYTLSCDDGYQLITRIKANLSYNSLQKRELITRVNNEIPQYCRIPPDSFLNDENK